MNDPLNKYNWNELYSDYDSDCKRFDLKSIYLNYFIHKSTTARSCYYSILEKVNNIYLNIKKNKPKNDFPIGL